jgi:hypothetical protein
LTWAGKASAKKAAGTVETELFAKPEKPRSSNPTAYGVLAIE